MQTNLFNCPVIQTVVFTLIPWILDQVEDDIVSIVIPASARESSVSTIMLLWRLRLLMQTDLFNGLVMQTVVFTLIPWILDRVEDDKRGGVIIPLLLSFPPPRGNPGLVR